MFNPGTRLSLGSASGLNFVGNKERTGPDPLRNAQANVDDFAKLTVGA